MLAPPAVLVVVLSPRFQDRLSGNVPVEVSVKVTTNGSIPLVGLAVKLATGGSAPSSSLYTVAKLSATTALPMATPSFGNDTLANCEMTNAPTEGGGVPLAMPCEIGRAS